MTVDWSKLDTAEMKSARVAEQNARAAEREAVAVLREAAKTDPTFNQVKDLSPGEYDDFVAEVFPDMSLAQRRVIRLLLRAAVIVVRQ